MIDQGFSCDELEIFYLLNEMQIDRFDQFKACTMYTEQRLNPRYCKAMGIQFEMSSMHQKQSKIDSLAFPRTSFLQFSIYCIVQKEKKKKKTNAHRSGSMNKAGRDHCGDK